ncbi:hypothetical protein GOODEAATRI_026753, partial [Goodea atripinnis]
PWAPPSSVWNQQKGFLSLSQTSHSITQHSKAVTPTTTPTMHWETPHPPFRNQPIQDCTWAHLATTGLPSYQPCAPTKPPGLPGCSSLLEDVSSSSYSTEVKVTEESGGVIKSLSFPPEPLQTKTERVDGYDYRYAYPNAYRYDDY